MATENNAKGYNVHNLTFIRNNSYAQKSVFETDQNYFFMMDYYNLLKERNLKHSIEGYLKLVDSGKGNERAVARRTMGMYVEDDGVKGDQIFQTAPATEDTTKEEPFLGMIQVYITDYLWKKDKDIDVQYVDEYLNEYQHEIEKCVNKYLEEKDLFQIFKTITAEDFCVVIRTSKIRKIYDVVIGLMDIKNGQNKRVFFTYTNIGIECVKRETASGPCFSRLPECVRSQNSDISFLLRFRIEKEALEGIRKGCANSESLVIETVNGMIGRYDLVAKFSVDEFVEIYPFLCMNVAGYDIGTAVDMKFKSGLVELIVAQMGREIIQTVNTRVIMDIYADEGCEYEQSVSLLDKADKEKTSKRSKWVMDLYEKFIKRYGTNFLMEKYRYNELTDMLDSLLNSYENLAYEIDTHINWFICSQYLEELFQNMYSYMEKVQQVEKVPEAVEKFLDDFQDSISALDAYLRLLQGINQNTIQAPRYDISAPIDGQKFLIAYSEFIDKIHDAYRNNNWDEKNSQIYHEKRRIEKTIIYPDVAIKNLELKEVFDYDTETQESDSQNPAILICKIPMFEYFERPYDLIPLVSHEICHHMLITNREARNDYLIKTIFNKVVSAVIKEVQIKFVKSADINKDDALTYLMIKCLSAVLEEDYKEQYPNWSQYVFRHLKKDIWDYVWTFFDSEEKKWNNIYVVQSPEDVVKEFEELINEVFEGTEIGIMLDELGQLDFRTSKLPEKYATAFKIKKMMERILNQINISTINYEKPIEVDQLSNKNSTELDFYLLQWAKENEGSIPLLEECYAEEQRRQRIKYYLELVERAFVIYAKAVVCSGSKADNRKIQIINRFTQKAKKAVNYFLEGDYYYIYDQIKVKKVAFWELTNENISQANYIDAMACIDPQKLSDSIEYSVKAYRETCADIIMCRWLGLDSFGYFRMSIALGPRMMRHSERLQFGGLQRERLATVLSVLINQEKPECVRQDGDWSEIDLTSLQEKLWEYVGDAMQCAKLRIISAMCDDGIEKEDVETAVSAFFDVYEKNISLLKKYTLQGKKIQWEHGICDLLCKGELGDFFKKEGYQTYFQKEVNFYRRLFDLLGKYGQLQRGNRLRIETESLRHMTVVYENMTKGEPLHAVVREVVNFYNNPKSEKKTNAQKMIDMLRFIQDYYYCNRIRKAEESMNEHLVCEKPE